MSPEEKEAINANRRKAYKKKKQLQAMPEMNSANTMYIDKEDRAGVYKVTAETEVKKVVTYYHSVELDAPLPKNASTLVFKDKEGKVKRASTSRVNKLKK